MTSIDRRQGNMIITSMLDKNNMLERYTIYYAMMAHRIIKCIVSGSVVTYTAPQTGSAVGSRSLRRRFNLRLSPKRVFFIKHLVSFLA
jgi:hypothetical protein